ncbi:unnamed protein product [Blepharisma stoltei]|uniref:Uncharacterized protein n=1 Tax=Blepharisma stoltei TaxID=1481888 RepID=A0AAU9JIM1_9CILI|nr:unnamed protein product [Blepharisma stoltei]
MNLLQPPTILYSPGSTSVKSTQKVLKIRRRVQPAQNLDNAATHKIVKVAHKAIKPKPSEIPLPGSMEEDFLLESEGNPIHFLRVKNPSTGNFEMNHRIFRADYSEDPKPPASKTPKTIEFFTKIKKSVKVLAENESPPPLKVSSLRNLFRKQTSLVSPEAKYNEKLMQIKEGMKKEAETEEKLLKSLKTGQRITETKQTHCLENYYSKTNYWHKIAENLSQKVNKQPQDLMLNSAPNFRQKKEECELLDKISPLRDKYGNLAWYLTLRQWPESEIPGEVWIPIGSQLTGLYTPIRHRCNTAQEVIRTVGSHASSRGSLRSSQYFRRKIKENRQKKEEILIDNEFDDMMVQGEAKFPIEKSAAENIGVKFVTTDIGNNILPEQTIELNYEVKVKY